jgi:hypothetical protein
MTAALFYLPNAFPTQESPYLVIQVSPEAVSVQSWEECHGDQVLSCRSTAGFFPGAGPPDGKGENPILM